MKTITKETSGVITVSEDTTYHHITASEVIVEPHIVARLYGIVKKRLHVKANATVYLHGRCDGEIVNEGGIIYQFLPTGTVECFDRTCAIKK